LNFYGIGNKDFALYQSYLDNRYCRTAIYNDRGNSNKVSDWAKVKHEFPQGSVLGPLLFLLYVNDLPKIMNETSKPIIFAADTSILFAHSNLIDLNKNIHIVFTALNISLRANQLFLDFNKTNYVYLGFASLCIIIISTATATRCSKFSSLLLVI
jgi:DNA polymerase III epsilon subunit-like protein